VEEGSNSFSLLIYIMVAIYNSI